MEIPLKTIEEGRRYRAQKGKGNFGGNKLKSYALRSSFLKDRILEEINSSILLQSIGRDTFIKIDA